MPVIGLFGPTASGKSDVAAAIAELIPAVVVSADAMQVYDGLPILTNRSPHPERLVGIWPLSHEASVGEYAPLAHAAIDEALAAGRRRSSSAGTGLYFRAALAELALPPAPATERARSGRASTTRTGADAAHAALARARSGRGRARPSERPPTRRARSRARRRGRVPRPATRTALRRRVAASDARRRARRPEGGARARGSRRARGGCSSAASRTRCARRSPAPCPSTARKVIGLDEIATFPREEAIEALIVRTRRYAAYQRKWLRSLEGAVMVAADRPPEETAAEIVELARAREHLSRP